MTTVVNSSIPTPLLSNGIRASVSVGSQEGYGIPQGHVICMASKHFQKGSKHVAILRCSRYGKVMSKAEFESFCILQGYLQHYSRNSVAFTSSRAFRKHTGKTVFDPKSFGAWMYRASIEFANCRRNK